MPLSVALLLSCLVNLILLWLVARKLMSLYTHSKRRRPERYCRRCSHFSIRPVASNDIIFLGDSITEGCEWSTLFPHVYANQLQIRNFGVGSDTSIGVLERLSPLLQGQPRAIFLLIGTNDIGMKIPLADTISNYRSIIEEIYTKSPRTTLYIQSILPRKAEAQIQVQTLNRALQTMALEHQVAYIDLYSHFVDQSGGIDEALSNDCLHLVGKGYRLWQELLAEYVEPLDKGAW